MKQRSRSSSSAAGAMTATSSVIGPAMRSARRGDPNRIYLRRKAPTSCWWLTATPTSRRSPCSWHRQLKQQLPEQLQHPPARRERNKTTRAYMLARGSRMCNGERMVIIAGSFATCASRSSARAEGSAASTSGTTSSPQRSSFGPPLRRSGSALDGFSELSLSPTQKSQQRPILARLAHHLHLRHGR